MKRKIAILFLVVMMMGGFLQAEKVAAIFKIVGEAQVKPHAERGFVAAYTGQMLESGDWVKTGSGSYIAILFLDKSMLKIRENTEMEIKSQRLGPATQNTDLFLAKGDVWSKVQKQKSTFTISTPTSVASVKGTEFFLEHDDFENLSSLYVVEGIVEFTNELGKILAQEMTYSTSEVDKSPAPAQRMSKSMVPTWDEEVEPEWGFNITPEKSGRQPILEPLNVTITAYDAKESKSAFNFSELVNVQSSDEFLQMSTEGNIWLPSLSIPLKNGKATIQVRAPKAGKYELIVSAANAEARKVELEFFRSANQKKALQSRLRSLAQTKGLESVKEQIETVEVEQTQVSGTNESAEDVLQRVQIGEYIVIGTETIENPDGSITIRLIVEPATIGGDE